MAPPRYLFLDVDGVINSAPFLLAITDEDRAKTPGMEKQFDPAAIERVNRITRAIDAHIVVSSSWRFMEGLADKLASRGLAATVVGITPSLEGSGFARNQPRGHEIQHWMIAHQVDEDRVVILDDDADMAHLLPRLVQTSFMTGLLDCHVEQAIALFG